MSTRESDFAEVKVDPKNPDVVYTASVVTWKSTDGGKTFNAFRGAPGGDDYHRIWINPNNPNIMLIASDQGAIVTVNGGETWSSWYNQPTAAFYHVAADNAFPYRVCSGQQESGSACVDSRGDDGRITGVGLASGRRRGIRLRRARSARSRHRLRRQGHALRSPHGQSAAGRSARRPRRRRATIRTLRTAPLVFSTVDPHALFFGVERRVEDDDGGKSWTQISPDLTRTDSIVPPSVGVYASSPHGDARGTAASSTPSRRRTSTCNRIWAGTDDGLIQTTADGGAHWTDVTPPELRAKPWSKISIMDAGRFDANTAYAAVNTHAPRRSQPAHLPHARRRQDVDADRRTASPTARSINVVREDPKRRGLLFAGSENQVWVSFDDGDHWSSLRLNMPATSIRDLIIKDDDIAVGTHGRSFWILDDIAPLRQITAATAASAATLFKPAAAVSLSLEQVSRHADPARRAVGPESARRRDHRLLPRRERDGRREARDSRRRAAA